jgi:hypothetical protein
METIVPYAIWAALILTSVSIVAIILFGIRSLAYGKVNPVSIATLVLPAIVMIGFGLALGDWARAAIWTFLVMLLLSLVALLLSSARGMFGL